jgi:FdrA protein
MLQMFYLELQSPSFKGFCLCHELKSGGNVKQVLIEKDAYYDSVFLMLINRDVKKIEGVIDAVVSMGTEMNITLLRDTGLADKELDGVTPNDLIIAIEGKSEEVVVEAMKAAKALMDKKNSGDEGEGYKPASLEGAIKTVPDANLVIISLPVEFATRDVRKSLNNGLHVMLFSDNISVESEIELKNLAKEKGLLMMGPDCGTAIVNGKPLCFANVVRPGDIGVVAASGTGLQEVTCAIEKFGGGITQGLGTGGRDLKNVQIGGTMMLMGIEALKNDETTKVIVVLSKPPADVVAEKVIDALSKTGKPSVIHFIGLEPREQKGNLYFAGNLEEAAGMAVALSKGETYKKRTYTIDRSIVDAIIEKETSGMSGSQKYIRGLYTGGTLADEALIMFDREIGNIYSNNQSKEDFIPADPNKSIEHTIVDLGDDVYTVGRPHPMIDPSTREDRIKIEVEDEQMAVMLLDIVLGYGSHEDPAGAILDSMREAKEKFDKRGGYLSIITSITGTEGDFQSIDATKSKLESIGCIVMPSNFQASTLALEIMRKVEK